MSKHLHLGAEELCLDAGPGGGHQLPVARQAACCHSAWADAFISVGRCACLQKPCLFGCGPVSTERWGGFSALRPTSPEPWVPCPSRGLAGGQRGALADPWPWATESGLLQPLHSSGIGFNCPAFNKVVLSLQVYDSYSPCLSTSCKSLESPSDL